MFNDRVTHQALMAVAAIVVGSGMVLLTAGVFGAYCSRSGTRIPLLLGVGGALCIVAGMAVAAYVKHRMRT